VANKVGDDHPDDDGERGGENDTENSSPHAFRSIIIGIESAQQCRSPLAVRQCDQREREYFLSRRKLVLAETLSSRALKADAVESITCGWLSLVVVVAIL
jgi:hypothetical protein